MRRGRVLAGVATVLAIVCSAGWVLSTQVAESQSRTAVSPDADSVARGAAAFMGAGFGGISTDALATNALPWRIAATALVLDERDRDPSAPLSQATLDRILTRFGFLVQARVVDLPQGVRQSASSLPLGMTHGEIAPVAGARIMVSNLGCASCHAGATYTPEGNPLPRSPALGMPNTSIDLEAYTLAVFRAMRRHIDSPELLPAAQALFPEMDWRERASLRLIVLPLARKRLGELAGADRPLPFTNGAPGSTNGVAALKQALGTPLTDGGRGDAGVVSIPDLGYRSWRTSLLADGVYAVPGTPAGPTTAPSDKKRLRALAAITTFFTVPSMGVHPDKARDALGDAEDVMAFLAAYRAQRFPGPVDRAAAARGRAVYAGACASCHGTYDESLDGPRLVSFPNWQGDVGTDSLRRRNFDPALADAVAKSPYRDLIAVRRGQGYAAPPLAGLWASAPYLHNGSVPTIAALLEPARRPTRFMVGGHALDFTSLGLKLTADGRYPQGYRPFSTPAWIDTTSPGRGAQGHPQGSELSDADKSALMEYLKLL